MGEVNKLQEKGLYGIIIGKAIYEGAITLKELEQFIIS
jgi:phosphoribosylformimino-5-aminoimidazole carboxamide ribonucleotide (ProFAR) isomerase